MPQHDGLDPLWLFSFILTFSKHFISYYCRSLFDVTIT